jgi:hypothetical protein
MTKIIWGTSGERVYEAGVDRGVLYVGLTQGVAWNGLTAVKENPSGGEAVPYYIDGFKYLNVSAGEEFEATIDALSSPLEFFACDGISSLANGLFATQQPRVSFGLSYRTKLGNDLNGLDHGYKIHLVYNALAAPSSRDNNTLNTASTPVGFSWSITSRPPIVSGIRPTAHLVVDSRKASAVVLTSLEGLLYGTDVLGARLPSPQELITLFGS